MLENPFKLKLLYGVPIILDVIMICHRCGKPVMCKGCHEVLEKRFSRWIREQKAHALVGLSGSKPKFSHCLPDLGELNISGPVFKQKTVSALKKFYLGEQ